MGDGVVNCSMISWERENRSVICCMRRWDEGERYDSESCICACSRWLREVDMVRWGFRVSVSSEKMDGAGILRGIMHA